MKVTGSSGIFKIIYHNANYLLLFGMINWNLEFQLSNSSCFEVSAALQ